MVRGEVLRRHTEDLFEFATKMRIGCEAEFSGGGLAGVTLGNELLGEPALQFPKPVSRRAAKVLFEDSLQVSLGNTAHGRHLHRFELRLFRHTLPILCLDQNPAHCLCCI